MGCEAFWVCSVDVGLKLTPFCRVRQAETCLEVMDKAGPDGQKNGKISLFEFMTFMERSDSSIMF